MIGWLTVLAAVMLLLRTKVGVLLGWKASEFSLKLRIGPFRIALPNEKKQTAQESGKHPKTVKPKRKAAAVQKLLPVIKAHRQELLELIGRIFRSPTLERLDLCVEAGGTDPEICAMNYGRICAAVSAALPFVEAVFHIKKQNIQVSCSYDKPNTTVAAEAELFLRLWELIALAAVILGKLISMRRTIISTQEAV